MVSRAAFVDEWSEMLVQGAATLFVGAGPSIGAGYPSWRTLLRKVGDELELDIEQEHDLAAVAQHYINKNKGKSRLTQMLARQFPKKPVPSVLKVMARLPLRQVWTTNWDELIETAFEEARRDTSVKDRPGDLTFERPDADVTIYKMHGSTRHIDEAVLATDDFELYRIKRESFLRILAGHLISTTFLFIGVSFSDPNLSHLLAGIREMHVRYSTQESGRAHYAIVRRPQERDYLDQENSAAKFKTAQIRYGLFVNDLYRYNIHCIEVDDHSEIEHILSEIEQRVACRAVFVSGSMAEGSLAPEVAHRVKAIARIVGEEIGRSGKRLVSGYGLGIGDSVVSGMLTSGFLEASANLDRRLTIRPFPQQIPEGTDRALFNRAYRENLVPLGGACIVVCGIRKKPDGSEAFEIAPGVLEEIEIAKKHGRLVVPIGVTFGTAQEVWKGMSKEVLDPRIDMESFKSLGDQDSDLELIRRSIGKILRSF